MIIFDEYFVNRIVNEKVLLKTWTGLEINPTHSPRSHNEPILNFFVTMTSSENVILNFISKLPRLRISQKFVYGLHYPNLSAAYKENECPDTLTYKTE